MIAETLRLGLREDILKESPAIAQLPDLDFEAMSAEELLRWARGEFGAHVP